MITPVSYLQTDIIWGGNDYSAKGEKTTIAKSGCGPTCVAMILATLVDNRITPADTCAWALSHGYKACKQGTYYSYIEAHLKEYNIKAKQLNSTSIYGKKSSSYHTKALEAIKAGKLVICCMGKGIWTSSGHYILWYGITGDNVFIRDPNSTKSTRICNKIDTLRKQVKYYWVIDPKVMQEDDEVVKSTKVNVFGNEYDMDCINKAGSNYVRVKDLAKAGLTISSQGAAPIIGMGAIKIKCDGKVKPITGFISNGTTYAALRSIAEALGHTVIWDSDTASVIIE